MPNLSMISATVLACTTTCDRNSGLNMLLKHRDQDPGCRTSQQQSQVIERRTECGHSGSTLERPFWQGIIAINIMAVVVPCRQAKVMAILRFPRSAMRSNVTLTAL